MKNVLESIEEDQKDNNTMKMCQTKTNLTKDININLAEIWKEYFDKLLNTQEPRELKKEIKKLAKLKYKNFLLEDVKKRQ
jgi:hypothetical protein